MKKIVLSSLAVVGVLLIGLSLYSLNGANKENLATAAYAEENIPTATVGTDYGSNGAKIDEELTLADMLTYAIQDEYRARAEYEKIMEVFGTQNPFANIMKAEEKHISSLEPLFAKYNITLPVDDGKEHVILPESLQVAYETGVQAEIENIAMYEKFLQDPNLPSDVKAVFTSLMNASKSHLAAFQNAADGNIAQNDSQQMQNNGQGGQKGKAYGRNR